MLADKKYAFTDKVVTANQSFRRLLRCVDLCTNWDGSWFMITYNNHPFTHVRVFAHVRVFFAFFVCVYLCPFA